MSQAEHANTTIAPGTRASRRSLFGGAALAFTAAASAVGITAGVAASIADLVPAIDVTPIMAAATRLSHLSSLEESEEVDEEQFELVDFITDCSPQSVGDVVVLLMVAASEISRKALTGCGNSAGFRG